MKAQRVCGCQSETPLQKQHYTALWNRFHVVSSRALDRRAALARRAPRRFAPLRSSRERRLRQTKFVQQVLLGAGYAEAVRKAGYKDVKDPHVAAWELRQNPKIRAAIAAGLQKLQLSREELVRIVERIAEANPKEYYDEDGNLINIRKLPDDLARAIKKVKLGEFGTEIELHSPLEAVTLLAKLHRLIGEYGNVPSGPLVNIDARGLTQGGMDALRRTLAGEVLNTAVATELTAIERPGALRSARPTDQKAAW
jgi:hypothetical protein